MSAAPPSVGKWNYAFRTSVYAGLTGLALWGAWRVNGALEQREQQLADAARKIASLQDDVAARDRTIAEQAEQIADLQQRVKELELALKLLKVDHRLARLKVLAQRPLAATGGAAGSADAAPAAVGVDSERSARDAPCRLR